MYIYEVLMLPSPSHPPPKVYFCRNMHFTDLLPAVLRYPFTYYSFCWSGLFVADSKDRMEMAAPLLWIAHRTQLCGLKAILLKLASPHSRQDLHLACMKAFLGMKILL